MYTPNRENHNPPQKVVRYFIDTFSVSFTGPDPFNTTTHFEKGEKAAHDFCGTVIGSIKDGSSVENWKEMWILILSNFFGDTDEKNLIPLSMRLEMNLPKTQSY